MIKTDATPKPTLKKERQQHSVDRKKAYTCAPASEEAAMQAKIFRRRIHVTAAEKNRFQLLTRVL